MTEIEVERLQAVELRPGDVLVVTLPGDTEPDMFHRMAEFMEQRFPDQKVLVVTSAIDLSAYRPLGDGS
jgi:hypothetical protein